MRVVAPVPASDARAVFLSWQPQQLTELWNLTGTHIHLASNSVGSHSYAQVLTAGLAARACTEWGWSQRVCVHSRAGGVAAPQCARFAVFLLPCLDAALHPENPVCCFSEMLTRCFACRAPSSPARTTRPRMTTRASRSLACK